MPLYRRRGRWLYDAGPAGSVVSSATKALSGGVYSRAPMPKSISIRRADVRPHGPATPNRPET